MRVRAALSGLGAAALGAATAATAAVAGAGATTATVTAALPSVTPAVAGAPVLRLGSTPPTTATCEAKFHIACYGPHQFQVAYDELPLFDRGLTGRGKTIAIVDAFGSPTIMRDLATFDRTYGLPAPPHFSVIQPAGKVPPFNPHNGTMFGWAVETTLDVEYAHSVAPGANILLVETPVAETEGMVGFPPIIKAENYVIDHHLADVITQSFGATEETFPRAGLLSLRSAYMNAAAHGVSVLASTGDSGAANVHFNGSTYYPYPTVGWPASDPLVTAVGGLQLHLTAQGHRTMPDNVWNDSALFGSPAAGGGGDSHVFARPAYQNGVAGVVGKARGIPDVSLSAAVDGGAILYWSFGGSPTWAIVGGTSEASPEMAGIVAIADQKVGHDLGLLNPRLYAMGSGSVGLPDITRGNNVVTVTVNGKSHTFGYQAVKGYDLASGLGGINATGLVSQLAR